MESALLFPHWLEVMVDGRSEECDFWNERRGRYDSSTTSELPPSGSRENYMQRTRASSISKGELFKFLALNRFAPIELIFSSTLWLESKFHFLSMSDRIVDKAIERYRLSCFVMNMKD